MQWLHMKGLCDDDTGSGKWLDLPLLSLMPLEASSQCVYAKSVCVCIHQVACSPEDQAIQEAIATGDAILQRLYQPSQDALQQRTASAATEAHSSWSINTARYCVAAH